MWLLGPHNIFKKDLKYTNTVPKIVFVPGFGNREQKENPGLEHKIKKAPFHFYKKNLG